MTDRAAATLVANAWRLHLGIARRSWALLVMLIVASCGHACADEKTDKRDKSAEELWFGTLDAGVSKLRLVVKMTRTDKGYRATMVSLDQGNASIPVDKVVRDDKHFKLSVEVVQGEFDGRLNADATEAKGVWTQLGRKMDLVLRLVDKIPEPATKQKRPQTPQPPFPYRAIDVQIENAQDGITLAGTLTLPPKPGRYPAVVLISGSGPQDRDETLLGHKPFLVLADHLTRRGVAVLRCDDRGFGKSTGDHATATTRDFANDVRAAVQTLANHPQVDRRRIGLIGHSEGGLIAPLVAAASERIAFVVLIGAPGVPGAEILAKQRALISRALGASESEITQSLALQRAVLEAVRAAPTSAKPDAIVEKGVASFLADLPESQREAARPQKVALAALEQLATPWFRYFIDHDPRPVLKKVRCPVLALWGQLDLQVAPDQNLSEVEKALKAGGNSEYEVVALAGLNHLLQRAQTGSPTEYNTIEETIAPAALDAITDWILTVVEDAR